MTKSPTLIQVADDLNMDADDLAADFSIWLESKTVGSDLLSPESNAACYAIYRITSLESSFRIIARSRERWRDRAMSLGSPGHLLEGWNR